MPEWSLPEDPAPVSVGTVRKGLARPQAKGAKGERDVLNAFRDIMRNVEQGAIDNGLQIVAHSNFAQRKRIEVGTSNRDIGNIPLISIEVKRQENLALNKAWEQTVRQADKGLLPVLCYRYNREAWRVRTWGALTHYDGTGRVVRYAISEVSLPDFLSYFASMYRDFLLEALR